MTERSPRSEVGILRWWERTYDVPRWIVWLAVPSITVNGIRAIHSMVVWFS